MAGPPFADQGSLRTHAPYEGRADKLLPREARVTAPARRGVLPFTAFAGAVALVLLGRAADLQLSRKSDEHAHALAAERRYTTVLPAARGRILDARGTVLAEDRPEHDVMGTPGALRAPERLAALAQVLALDERARAALEKRVRERAARHPWVPIVVARSVSDATAAALRGPSRVPGTSVTTAPRRRYPHGAAFASLVGHVGREPARAPSLVEDRAGRVGVEKAFDSRLRGTPGKRVAPASRFVRGEPTLVEEPTAGSDVTLTVDARLTNTAARALRTSAIRSGAVVVLDPRDGALLASISSPAIDPDKLARGTLDDAGDRPWVDRTRKLAHAPGSLVKPFYLLAALSHGHDGAHTCTGSMSFGKRTYRCTRAHGRVDAAHAVSSSCNVFFFETGVELGSDALNDVLHRAGMLGPIGMPVGEPEGSFRSAAPTTRRPHRRIGDTLNASIGQGELRVSPLAVAVAYGALANGGRVLTPRVLATDETVERGTLPARDALASVRAQLVARSRELARDHEPLPGDVAATFGAARSLRDGMARDDHWFAAFAPADAPRVVVVVFGEESSQSTVAGVGLGVLAAALAEGDG